MNNRKLKAYIRLTLTFTLIFSIVAATAFAVVINMMDGKFLGYDIGGENSKTYVNVALLGVDKDGTRTDVIILGQLNMVDNSISLLQIPRDTYVANNGRRDRKINSAWGAGKQNQVFKEIEMITGIEVENYVLVDTSQFRDIIDDMGGVEFNVPINMNYDDPAQNLHIHLEKGLQVLDGDKAEQFVRFRQNNNGSGYARGDVERLEAQQGFIKAAIDQLFSLTNTFRIPKIVSRISGMLQTNMSNSKLLSYAPYIFKVDRANVNIMTLAGEGRYIGGGSYYVPFDSQNQQIVQQYFTPQYEEMNEDEISMINDVIGSGGEQMEVDYSTGEDAKKSFANRFVKVDIIDASDGVADIEWVEQMLKDYGYSVTAVTDTLSYVSQSTQVVAKSDNGKGDNIAKIFGLAEFTLNTDKSNGTQITIILGKDMS